MRLLPLRSAVNVEGFDPMTGDDFIRSIMVY